MFNGDAKFKVFKIARGPDDPRPFVLRHIAGITPTGGFADTGDGGPATDAQLNQPGSLAVGPDGALYISTQSRIRVVDGAGLIFTYSGSTAGYAGDGGPASAAKLRNTSQGITFGPDGGLYLADSGNNRIRRVSPAGIITTVAGNGLFGFAGDGGPALAARLRHPEDVAVLPDGSMYIADRGNDRVRRVSPDGIISTVMEDVDATALTFSPDGYVYVASFGTGKVYALMPPGAALLGVDGLFEVASEDGAEVYVFELTGRHVRTVDALTGVTIYEFAHDEEGRLFSVTDRDGNQTSVQRDASGELTGIAAPGGQTTALAIGGDGFLASISNPAGETYEAEYTDDGLMVTFEDPRDHPYTFEYDALGRLEREDDPANGFKTLTRVDDESGYTVTLTTAEGRVRAHAQSRQADGSQQQVNTFPTGLQTVVATTASGTKTITFADGTVVTQEIEPDPRWALQAPVPARVTVTLPSGLQTVVEESREVDQESYADRLSLLQMMTTTSINGRAYTSTYIAADAQNAATVAFETPEMRQTLATLDDKARVSKIESAPFHPLWFDYDPQGRLQSIAHGPDPNDPSTRVTRFDYKSTAGTDNDYLDKITDSLGRELSLDYDEAGRVDVQTLPDGKVIGFAYDDNGNLTSLTPPGRPAHGFDLTPVDLVSEYAPPQPSPTIPEPRTRYSYNLDRQLTQILRPDNGAVDFTYDSGGRLDTISLPSGETRTYAYYTALNSPGPGMLGNLKSITGDDADLEYTYDGPLRLKETWSGAVSGTVERGIDNDFRVDEIKVNGATVATLDYDDDGLLTSAGDLVLSRDAATGLLSGTTLGLVTDSWTYGAFAEPESYVAQVDGSDVFSELIDERDALGRITQKTETVEGVTTVYEYRYDDRGRLDEVNENGVVATTYTYDDNGNRLSRVRPGETCTYAYDDQDRLQSYDCGAGTISFTYTANGELETKTEGAQTTAYDYDAAGNLRAVSMPNGDQIEYLIDGRDRRVGKAVNSVVVQKFLYLDQLNPVAELDGNDNVVATFTYGAKPHVPDYMIKGGVKYRILSDHLGSVRLAVNETTGVMVRRMVYDEFGRVLADTNPGFEPFGFVGGIYDSYTSSVRFGARDYDFETGRWTTKDPIGFDARDTDLYAYAFDDPVNLRDVSGLDIAVIEGGPTEGNPIGHTAIAVTGKGVYSYGNSTRPGTSLIGYLLSQSANRNQRVFIIPTTAEQDTAALEYLVSRLQDPLGMLTDNCSSRSNDALDAVGLPNSLLPDNLPGSAGATALKAGADSYTIKKGRTSVPVDPFLQFEPH